MFLCLYQDHVYESLALAKIYVVNKLIELATRWMSLQINLSMNWYCASPEDLLATTFKYQLKFILTYIILNMFYIYKDPDLNTLCIVQHLLGGTLANFPHEKRDHICPTLACMVNLKASNSKLHWYMIKWIIGTFPCYIPHKYMHVHEIFSILCLFC